MIMDININKLQKVFEIELNSLPNQEFDFSADGFSWNVKIQTFMDNQTRVNVYKDNVCVCWQAPIHIFLKNLLAYSGFDEAVLFFAGDDGIESVFYEDLGDRVRLYYGNF